MGYRVKRKIGDPGALWPLSNLDFCLWLIPHLGACSQAKRDQVVWELNAGLQRVKVDCISTNKIDFFVSGLMKVNSGQTKSQTHFFRIAYLFGL